MTSPVHRPHANRLKHLRKVSCLPPSRTSSLAALGRKLPAGRLMFSPTTLLRWHREFVRRRWAAFPQRHLRTQISTPWTNGKIEAFCEVLQSVVLDRQLFSSLTETETALSAYAGYYNYHRLSGSLGWQTPAERYSSTPFTDRGFEHIPALQHLQPWLVQVMAAA